MDDGNSFYCQKSLLGGILKRERKLPEKKERFAYAFSGRLIKQNGAAGR